MPNTTATSLSLVFLGGGLGSLFRYLAYLYRPAQWSNSLFPIATLGVNTAACFLMGLGIGLMEAKQGYPKNLSNFWTIGLCGGLSTFSTFAYDIILLARTTSPISTGLYISLSIALGIVAIGTGAYLGKIC